VFWKSRSPCGACSHPAAVRMAPRARLAFAVWTACSTAGSYTVGRSGSCSCRAMQRAMARHPPESAGGQVRLNPAAHLPGG
jgi:hypothetical protein